MLAEGLLSAGTTIAIRSRRVMYARQPGGNKRSRRIEAYRDMILAAIEEPGLRWSTCRSASGSACGHFARCTKWRYLEFHSMAARNGMSASRSGPDGVRSAEHTSELQSLMRISYAVSCLKKKK